MGVLASPGAGAGLFVPRWQRKARDVMDVILHIGAHRCATTSFQAYMRSNAAALQRAGTGFWGPLRMRRGAFRGILTEDDDAAQAVRKSVATALDRAQDRGIDRLIVSDENMLGTIARNLSAQALYPDAGARIARFAALFGNRLARIVLSVRSPDHYWASCMAYATTRGRPLPDSAVRAAVAQSPRSWRDVVTDIGLSMPGVPLRILPHERFAALADHRLDAMVDGAHPAPRADSRLWLNRAPDMAALRAHMGQRTTEAPLPLGDGPLRPFSEDQRAMLRESYHDDLFWLTAGADGLADLASDPWPAAPAQADLMTEEPYGLEQTVITPRRPRPKRGHADGTDKERLVRTR